MSLSSVGDDIGTYIVSFVWNESGSYFVSNQMRDWIEAAVWNLKMEDGFYGFIIHAALRQSLIAGIHLSRYYEPIVEKYGAYAFEPEIEQPALLIYMPIEPMSRSSGYHGVLSTLNDIHDSIAFGSAVRIKEGLLSSDILDTQGLVRWSEEAPSDSLMKGSDFLKQQPQSFIDYVRKDYARKEYGTHIDGDRFATPPVIVDDIVSLDAALEHAETADAFRRMDDDTYVHFMQDDGDKYLKAAQIEEARINSLRSPGVTHIDPYNTVAGGSYYDEHYEFHIPPRLHEIQKLEMYTWLQEEPEDPYADSSKEVTHAESPKKITNEMLDAIICDLFQI